MTDEVRPAKMSLAYISAMLAWLPAYVEVTVKIAGIKDQRLLSRDMPGEGRRFTNLTTGTEWFLPFNDYKIDITSVQIPALDIDVIR